MTCGGTVDVRVRKGKTIVAYCIAQCKRHGGNRVLMRQLQRLTFPHKCTKRQLLKGGTASEGKDQVE
jgi:hypothetical protein